MGEDAVVLAPELVLVEAAPNRVLFDMQDELRAALLELHDLRFDDGRNVVAARSHARTVDLVTAVVQDDVAHHPASIGRVDV